MPDNDLTGALSEILEVLRNVTVTMALSNGILSYLVQSSMSLIWGLINYLQILTYLPLINVAMPANAYMVFLIMLEMASFDIVPYTDQAVDQIEDNAKIRDDAEYILSDSFSDFGFTSTNMI